MTSLVVIAVLMTVLYVLHTAIKYVMGKEKVSKLTTIALLLCVFVVILNLTRVPV